MKSVPVHMMPMARQLSCHGHFHAVIGWRGGSAGWRSFGRVLFLCIGVVILGRGLRLAMGIVF